jgi:catalase
MTQQTQYQKAAEIVEKIHAVLGKFPGYRTLHADGRLYRGSFKAYPVAKKYTRAIHLQGDEIPVTVRYSKGGGDPFAHFSATVGMATRFYLPDGRVTNLVMLSQKLFVARSIDQFLALVDAAAPLSPGQPPNLEGLKAVLPQHPNSAAVFKMRAESPAPVSFANTQFHAVHAFLLSNTEGVATPARIHWTPVAGVKGQPVAQLASEDVSFLFEEMDGRLKKRPTEFELELELAEPGDVMDDPTLLWPEDRKRMPVGRLVISQPTTEAEFGDPVMNHDPTVLVDGIDATDDPIIQIRRGVYEMSAALRSGGWKHVT